MSTALDVVPPSFHADAPRPELGALIATLTVMMGDQRSIVLHVTAARHGEGTTTVAREVSAAAARMPWCRVALVDAAPLGVEFGLPSLLGSLHRGKEPFLRPGRIGGAPVSLGRLTGLGEGTPRPENVRALFARLRNSFTLVVIDSPPVLPCREATIAAGLADGALLVVQAQRTPRAEIGQARQILEQMGATLLGAVLNQRRHFVPRFVGRLI